MPERGVVIVPIPSNGKGEVLQVTVVGGGDDQQLTWLEAMPGKDRQQMKRIEMLNYLGGNNRIKQACLCSDQGGVAVHTQLVEGYGGQLLPC